VELRELRQLREENGRLKRLVADRTLDRQILQQALTKKFEAGAATGAGVGWARDVWPISERRCRLFLMDRSSHRYE